MCLVLFLVLAQNQTNQAVGTLRLLQLVNIIFNFFKKRENSTKQKAERDIFWQEALNRKHRKQESILRVCDSNTLV